MTPSIPSIAALRAAPAAPPATIPCICCGRDTGVPYPRHGTRQSAAQIALRRQMRAVGIPEKRVRGWVWGRNTNVATASFNQVIKDNSDAGNIAIYFDRNPAKPSVVAVLNGNGPTGPGWSDFRVNIEFRPTPQWLKWRGNDGKLLPQVEFADFVEDNLEDISEPPGATMLETFNHDQDDKASVGPGTIEVPQTFMLGIMPIFGLGVYGVPARFRYRVEDGKLKLGYKLQRIETLMEKIVEDVISKIERGADISVMDGLPPG